MAGVSRSWGIPTPRRSAEMAGGRGQPAVERRLVVARGGENGDRATGVGPLRPPPRNGDDSIVWARDAAALGRQTWSCGEARATERRRVCGIARAQGRDRKSVV